MSRYLEISSPSSNFLSAFIILIFIAILLSPAFIGAAAYTYDALNRLIRVDYDNGTSVQYFYDEVGNRIQAGGIENVVITASAGSNFSFRNGQDCKGRQSDLKESGDGKNDKSDKNIDSRDKSGKKK